MISFRDTGEAELAGLDALFRDRFGHPFDAESWDWKYRRTPGSAISRVAVDEAGEVLAHAGALAFPAHWRGGSGLLWSVVDIAGRTGKGQGLRPPMLDLLGGILDELPHSGDFPWVTGFPNRRHYQLGRRAFDYVAVATKVPLWGELPTAPPRQAGAEPQDTCPPEAEAIWTACDLGGVVRSGTFLNWRYYARPSRYYRFYRLSSGSLMGLAVFAFVGPEAWAAELWLPAGGDWYDALLAVAGDLRRAGIERWRFWPSADAVQQRVLERLSLRKVPKEETLVCWQGPVDRALSDFGLYFSMGDHDAV
ncbi:MAG: hypothetical protein AAF604_01245 [Acidobacteriota bacterium]